jgi:hypothetical protein
MIAMRYGMTSILTLIKPEDILPILLNADFERSMMRPLTFEPKGKCLWAAVF